MTKKENTKSNWFNDHFEIIGLNEKTNKKVKKKIKEKIKGQTQNLAIQTKIILMKLTTKIN